MIVELPIEIRNKIQANLDFAEKQNLPESKARLTGILAKIDAANAPDNQANPIVLQEASEAVADIPQAVADVTREALFKISAMASAKADEIEGRPERERQERAAESRRLKQEALARVRERANKNGS